MSFALAVPALENSVAAVFDEIAFILVPMTAGKTGVNATPMADPDRDAFNFLGSIDLGPAAVQPAFHTSRSIAPTAAGAGSGVSHEAVVTALSSAWPCRPRIGDRIVQGAMTWQIAAQPRDGSDRLALYVNRAKM